VDVVFDSNCRRDSGLCYHADCHGLCGDSTSHEKRGSAMGMIGAAMGMGMVFGPALGGMLSRISLAFPFIFAGLLAMPMPLRYGYSCLNRWPGKTGSFTRLNGLHSWRG
jgi:MFS family permease